MTTIPDTMRIIAKDVQCTFEELIKLLIRKSLRPALNPLGQNTKIVYNVFRSRYERGFIGSSPEDNINKYSYIMTNDSIGWTGESITNFKVMAKFMKNSIPLRFPQGNTSTHNLLKSKSRVPFSDHEPKHFISKMPSVSANPQIPAGLTHSGNGVPSSTQYKNFLSLLTSRNMQSVIANKKAAFAYTSDVPYTHAFKPLESIGKDIIDQTDPSISGCDSAKMSTAMLRVKLYNLEQDLANLSVDHPNIYDQYIDMIRVINSMPRSKLVWIINLIAALSYQSWENLPANQQQSFTNALGEDFICSFNSNELITILLQSNSSEIILTSSYLFSLLKMLFIVFGYSKLVPLIADKCCDSQLMYKDNLKKHLDRYRGASFRRGDSHGPTANEQCNDYQDNCSESSNNPNDGPDYNPNYNANYNPNNNTNNLINGPNNNLINGANCNQNYNSNNNSCDNSCDDSCNNSYDPYNKPCNQVFSKPCIGACPSNCPDICYDPCKPCPEPVDQCIYDFIKLFGDLYPTIIGLMGGTEVFPPESIEITCNDIPANYNCLRCLPEYFWRFNDYSYCRYIEYIGSKQLGNALASKVNAKARYLCTMN